jgi:asparagine N-glycosylation enzyme membrane subunit Stt3
MQTEIQLGGAMMAIRYWIRAREYEVEFMDGATDTFTANIIAESMYSQVDEEDGNSYSLISEIVDHTSDGTAVRTDGGFEVTTDGRQRH